MKIEIHKLKKNVFKRETQLEDLRTGEIPHIVCELDSLKRDLLKRWEVEMYEGE